VFQAGIRSIITQIAFYSSSIHDKVILSHYDDFGSPYKHGEDPTIPGEIKFVPFANYGGFLTRLNELKTKHNYHYDIYQPKTGQCIRFPVSNQVASCGR